MRVSKRYADTSRCSSAAPGSSQASSMGGWQPMETAPKDGSWILAHGLAYQELAERGRWFTHRDDDPRVPHTMLMKWIEGWYEKEIDLVAGTFRKEKTQGYAYWWPEPHGFRPTHWMPLPSPPTGPVELRERPNTGPASK